MQLDMRRIIINADDIGLHPAIDNGVAMLAERGIVTSASVMVLGRPDRDMLHALRRQGIGLGLHLDLTSSMAQARYGHRYGVREFLLAAWARQLEPQQVKRAIHEQLSRFGELIGTTPAFVDGHEHVHQFPVIRNALMEMLGEGAHKNVYVRDTRPQRWRGLKAALIGALGAPKLAKETKRAGLHSNRDFFGVYNLSEKANLPQLWRDWLASIPSAGALAMCHPAMPHPALERFRQREYYFLASSQFADLMAEHCTVPATWHLA